MNGQMSDVTPEDALRELAYLYQTQGADAIREVLKESNFPDHVIEQLIQMLEITSQMDEDDEEDEDEIEGVATLDPEVINAICQNTYAVMTGSSEHYDVWVKEITTLYIDIENRGVEWEAELAFLDAIIAILHNQPIDVPDDNPYVDIATQVQKAIEAYHQES
ncbi:MAG: hypothetical protein ACOYLB_12120 [Phototrophicaceae bacterium]